MVQRAGKILILILVLSLVPGRTIAQEKQLTLHFDHAPLREVMDAIELQTGLSFAYRSRLIDELEEVTVHVENVSLEGALRATFSGDQVSYQLLEKQIVLRRSRVPMPPPGDVQGNEGPPVTRYTLSGYARDAASGEVLIGATVYAAGSALGTITNQYGFFSLTLEVPVDTLACTFIGYKSQRKPVRQVDMRVEFGLAEQIASLEEVVIYSEVSENLVKTSRSSEERIMPESVRKMPALMGEKDVIKSLAAIPGVKFYGDGSTIFFVRGGSRDQNMITLDEAPVYNPTHLLGLFSTIVPDAIKEIQVYKGDFPANYGGRLSSLIDIRTKDGNMNQFGMDGSLGVLSARLSLEGPIWKDHISYFISGRRSYFGRTVSNINPAVRDLHFADLHLKLNYRINEKNRLFFATYNSEDNFQASGGAGDVAGINWQNSTFTLRWNHLFSDRLFSNTTMYASNYDYFLHTNYAMGNYWNSHIDNFSIKSDFTYYVIPGFTLRYGGKIAQHFINPGNYYQGHELIPLPYEISTRSANELALYVSSQVVLTDRLSLRAGLRLTTWSNIGPGTEYYINDAQLNPVQYASGEVYHTYIAGDPRFSLAYRAGNDHMLTFSYSRTSQFEHLVTNSNSPFTSLEVWLPSGPNIRPQYADQVTAGYSHNLGNSGIRASVEAYYKSMQNQVDYRDHAKILLNPFLDYELRTGQGRAYGLETMFSRTSGRLTGSVSYTLARSMLRIPGINQGNPYPAYGDRPHDFSCFVSYRLSPRLELSGNFIYMTGSPVTTPTAFYYYGNYQVPVYYKRNNDRLPDYHRLDLALNWNLRKKEGRFSHELIFSVYNLYGRKNPVALHFNKIEDAGGNLLVPYNYYTPPELVPSMFYLYTVVPSIAYHFSF